MKQALCQFRESLDDFVFFHLGSDAVVKVLGQEAGADVSIEHPRVHSFQFHIEGAELSRLAADASQFEEFMLDQLTAHRKS